MNNSIELFDQSTIDEFFKRSLNPRFLKSINNMKLYNMYGNY